MSKRTRKCCVLELRRTLSILSSSSERSGSSEGSGSYEGSDILFEYEIRGLSAKQKQQLLHSAGIKFNIEPTQGLAIKSMIGIMVQA